MSSNFPLPTIQGTRAGYFAEITLALIDIRDRRASGRLSMRNSEKFGLAHLYFREARLVHVAGDKHGGEAVLQDLLTWSKGSSRFDATALVEYDDVTWQQAQQFERWVAFLEMRGRLQGIPQQRLRGLTHSLTIVLPGKPVALPRQVGYYEKYGQPVESTKFMPDNQVQLDGSSTQQLFEQEPQQEQGTQVLNLSRTALRQVDALVQQTRHVTQELAQRVVKVTQGKVQQATDIAGRTVKHVAIRADEVVQTRKKHENSGDGF
jgi:hypothetical protein